MYPTDPREPLHFGLIQYIVRIRPNPAGKLRTHVCITSVTVGSDKRQYRDTDRGHFWALVVADQFQVRVTVSSDGGGQTKDAATSGVGVTEFFEGRGEENYNILGLMTRRQGGAKGPKRCCGPEVKKSSSLRRLRRRSQTMEICSTTIKRRQHTLPGAT